jgi:RNA polymerase-binding transcription factor DksA
VPDRRAALAALSVVSLDGVEAASSGCAQDGAYRAAVARAEAAALALTRLDEGLAEVCLGCGGTIPSERFDAVLTAVRCVSCA